ncbi:GNAT family N-acetyltransferase [Paenibacillus sp. HJL G12]|uniref:GNAT family N-acetyltransferase n=1 Tax=Paenibacillus dendrobii TaxID=2691084 RepID=A0A7X3LG55_9BACL|nr:GNAT family N-acetyltransferase [Paenibacillus dendrobii]MWV44376.1 GNAT family N-acetyltransferase [Paenibacillus dendrobii]
MNIREWEERDTDEMVELFYHTVHMVNSRDYSLEQLNAWADLAEKGERKIAWLLSFRGRIAYVAEDDGIIAGFVDMTSEGYVDRLYVHQAYQRRGVASALLGKVEREARNLQIGRLWTEASVTAKAFFERKGYCVTEEQRVLRKGIPLTNYVMIKTLNI